MGHRSERVEQVVERPGNDDDVVDVEPEGQHDGGYSNTWGWRRSISVKYEKRLLALGSKHITAVSVWSAVGWITASSEAVLWLPPKKAATLNN